MIFFCFHVAIEMFIDCGYAGKFLDMFCVARLLIAIVCYSVQVMKS